MTSSLKFPDDDYIHFDPCDGVREENIRFREVKLCTARKHYPCLLGAGSYGDQHTIKPGDTYRYEKALVDGNYWGKYRVCVPCMDKWLSQPLRKESQ